MTTARTTMATIDLGADYIDVRAITDRIDDLESSDTETSKGIAEYAQLRDVLRNLRGYGGDHKWRGDWYPVTLISDQAFRYYVQDMLEDCGTIPADFPNWIEIDWNATARNVQMDYTGVEILGRTYYYR